MCTPCTPCIPFRTAALAAALLALALLAPAPAPAAAQWSPELDAGKHPASAGDLTIPFEVKLPQLPNPYANTSYTIHDRKGPCYICRLI